MYRPRLRVGAGLRHRRARRTACRSSTRRPARSAASTSRQDHQADSVRRCACRSAMRVGGPRRSSSYARVARGGRATRWSSIASPAVPEWPAHGQRLVPPTAAGGLRQVVYSLSTVRCRRSPVGGRRSVPAQRDVERAATRRRCDQRRQRSARRASSARCSCRMPTSSGATRRARLPGRPHHRGAVQRGSHRGKRARQARARARSPITCVGGNRVVWRGASARRPHRLPGAARSHRRLHCRASCKSAT